MKCFLRRHKRGKTKYKGSGVWYVECKRCGHSIDYESPMARLVGEEIEKGFTGE